MVKIIPLILFFSLLPTFAYDIYNLPNPTKVNGTYFSNPDNIIAKDVEQAIAEQLKQLELDTTQELTVVVVNTIGSANPKEFSTSLFNHWGIGKHDTNNGAMILVVMDQRRFEIEVGIGLEEVLTNEICDEILQEIMVPTIRNHGVDAAVLEGVNAIDKILRGENHFNATPQLKQPKNKGLILSYLGLHFSFVTLICFGVILLGNFIYFLSLRKKNNLLVHDYLFGKNDDLNSSPVAKFFFFLTFFILKQYKQYLSRKMLAKKQDMKRKGFSHISEQEENKYLTEAQAFEEEIGASEFDVFYKVTTERKVLVERSIPFNIYEDCKKCGTKAYYMVRDVVVRSATTVSTGRGRRDYECKYCHHKDSKFYNIPKKSSSSSRSSGSSFGGGSSRGGGSGASW